MVHPYSKKLLAFIEGVHEAKSYAGVTELENANDPKAKRMRSVYRWQRELGKELQYFPEIKFSLLGLCHAHVFVEEPEAGMFRFPYAVEYAWLVQTLGEHVLYLHCLVPTGDRESVGYLLQGLKDGGLCRSFSCCWTGDGWQALQPLTACFDAAGHVNPTGVVEASWPVPVPSERGLGALEGCPLLVPVIFEHYGSRLSLNQVWTKIYQRIGQGVWAFFPKRQRKWTVNGKAYIKKALEQVNAQGLFLQNRVLYKPFLQKAV
jgi:hypothetical protein